LSGSARLKRAGALNLTGQGAYDPLLGSGHMGILNSPNIWNAPLGNLAARPLPQIRRRPKQWPAFPSFRVGIDGGAQWP